MLAKPIASGLFLSLSIRAHGLGGKTPSAPVHCLIAIITQLQDDKLSVKRLAHLKTNYMPSAN